jgi:hypothetical protein
VYEDTGVTEVDRVTGIYIQLTPEYIVIISFLSHLIMQWKYSLYLSDNLVSLTLSEISWNHAIEWVLNAG